MLQDQQVIFYPLMSLLFIEIQTPSLGEIHFKKIFLDAVSGMGSFRLFASVGFSAGLRTFAFFCSGERVINHH